LRSSAWRRLRRDVYADAVLPVDHRLLVWGVSLVAPKGTVFGGLSALVLAGGHTFATSQDPVEVVLHAGTRWRPGPGVRVRSTSLDDDVLVDGHGLSRTGPIRTRTRSRSEFPVGRRGGAAGPTRGRRPGGPRRCAGRRGPAPEGTREQGCAWGDPSCGRTGGVASGDPPAAAPASGRAACACRPVTGLRQRRIRRAGGLRLPRAPTRDRVRRSLARGARAVRQGPAAAQPALRGGPAGDLRDGGRSSEPERLVARVAAELARW